MQRLWTVLLVVVGVAVGPGAVEALQATVTWTDNSTNETGFRVERRDGPDAAPWTSQGTVAANVSTFNQSGLALGTRYCYRVIAVNALGDSAPSVEACGTPDAPLPASGITVIFAP